MSTGKAFELEVVSYAYTRERQGETETVRILDEFSLDLKTGQIIALMAPSGAGKSTLLRLISGMARVNDGKVSALGAAPRPLLEKGRISVASADGALLPWRTALENIRLPLDLLGISRARGDQMARQLLDDLKLVPHVDKRPDALSEGQKQRLRLAQALATEPDLLLLDEPFNNADEGLRNILAKHVTRYVKASPKRSAVLVTHTSMEAAAMADVIVVLSGPPLRVLHAERVPTPSLERTVPEVLDLAASLQPYLLKASAAYESSWIG